MNKYGIRYSRHEYRTEYLQSPEWKEKRERIMNRDPACTICRTVKSRDVHHLTYDNVPFELDEDLVAVCRECHTRIHAHPMLAQRKSLMSLKWVFHESLKNPDLLVIRDIGLPSRREFWRRNIAKLPNPMPETPVFRGFCGRQNKRRPLDYGVR